MAEEKSIEGLEQPLLLRLKGEEGKQLLRVNFGKDTMAILVDVKHLKKDFPSQQVPTKVLEIFERFDDFKSYNNLLDRIVDLYNYLKTDTNPIEYRLFQQEMLELDRQLRPAETTVNWVSDGISDYIQVY